MSWSMTKRANARLRSQRHPDVLEWGFALEYSVIYLQSQVQDMHLPAPIDRLVPLVEFALETPLNRGARGQTTGTINPGVIWAGKYFQIGAEAVIPINSRTGNDVGFVALHLTALLPRRSFSAQHRSPALPEEANEMHCHQPPNCSGRLSPA